MGDKGFALALAKSIPKGDKGDTGLQGEVPAAALATKETSTTASKAYAVGDYFYYSDKLYKVTAAIASGGTITVGTNCAEAALADDVSDLKSEISNLTPIVNAVNKEVNPEPYIVNMFDFFWANGTNSLSSKVTDYATIETQYLIVSGSEGDTTLTIDEESPIAIGDLYSKSLAAVMEYDDESVDLVSLLVVDNALTIYPPLKTDVTAGKIYSLAYGIHLSAAGYRYYTDSFYGMNRKYARKKKALAQYNPFDSATTNPLTKVGSYWWGAGSGNLSNNNLRSFAHVTTNYLNLSFVTGATEQAPKGFEWQQNLGGKSGYFEMYIGGLDTTGDAEFTAGLEFNIEWYLDGVLTETYVKKQKKAEPVRFDFSGAQTGKIRLTVTGGASTYQAHLSQATWWLTDETDGCMFDDYKVPCLFMDSWGVYHDNTTAVELATLLTTDSGMAGYVVNNSLGSKTSAWGVENFYAKVWAEHPSYMITDFQINDINTGVTKAEYITNMKNLLSASVANGIIPVYLGSAHNNSGGNYSAYTFPLIAALTELPT